MLFVGERICVARGKNTDGLRKGYAREPARRRRGHRGARRRSSRPAPRPRAPLCARRAVSDAFREVRALSGRAPGGSSLGSPAPTRASEALPGHRAPGIGRCAEGGAPQVPKSPTQGPGVSMWTDSADPCVWRAEQLGETVKSCLRSPCCRGRARPRLEAKSPELTQDQARLDESKQTSRRTCAVKLRLFWFCGRAAEAEAIDCDDLLCTLDYSRTLRDRDGIVVRQTGSNAPMRSAGMPALFGATLGCNLANDSCWQAGRQACQPGRTPTSQ